MSNNNILQDDIKIEVTQDITPEVIDGLKLYASLTSRQFNQDKWLYWFKYNPYGKGLHAIAKYRESVIGFYSLIPTEFFLAGKFFIGAKGEFLVVDPVYRNKRVKGSSYPLAIDLIKTLNCEASYQGICVILAVAVGRAAQCHKFLGAKKFEFSCQNYFTFFRMPDMIKNRIKRNLIQIALFSGIFSFPKRVLKIKSFMRNCKHEINRVQMLNSDREYNFQRANRLVSSSSKMINFRFPDKEYIKYMIHGDQNTNYFVFTKPEYKSNVVLKDWSTLDLKKSEFEFILNDIFMECDIQKAESLNLYIPYEHQKIRKLLHSIGLPSRKSNSTFFYLYAPDDLISELRFYPWEFTNAHIGYI